MARIHPASVFLPALVGVPVGFATTWGMEGGIPLAVLVGVVGMLLAALVCVRFAGRDVWPNALLGGLAAGLAAAVPVYFVVDFVTNFCIFDCPPHDPRPALQASGAVVAGSLAVHALVAAFVAPQPQDAPLPDLPE